MAKIIIDGKEIPLLFNMDAWKQIERNIMPLRDIIFHDNTPKTPLNYERAALSIRIAEILAKEAGCDIDEKWLRKHCKPGQSIQLRTAVIEAITEGLEFEAKSDGPRDLVLEQLNTQKKNGSLSYRQTIAFGLMAGLSLTECGKQTPGYIIDMFIYRRQYDFMLHGLREK